MIKIIVKQEKSYTMFEKKPLTLKWNERPGFDDPFDHV